MEKLKIAFIVNAFPKISETFILNQIIGLRQEGHQVDIYAFDNPRESKIHDKIIEMNIGKHVFYPVPKKLFNRLILASLSFIKNVYKFELNISTLNFRKYGHDAKSLRLFLMYTSLVNKKYDVIHCHFGNNGKIMSDLKNVGLNIPFTTTFHGYDLSKYIQKNGNNIYASLFQNGDCFLPISEYWRSELLRCGCDPNRIKVLHMGVNLDDFIYSEREPANTIKILTIGRLVEKKGHEYAIKAVAQLVQNNQNVLYQIAGDGPLKKELEQLIIDLNVEQYVTLLGSVDDSKLETLYRESHIFLLPSVAAANGDMEGIPVVLMEAQAVGLPVVSTYHSGIPELVKDGLSGFLVPERDIDAITEKLEFLVSHPEIWKEMGKNGRNIVEEDFNQSKLTRQLENIFLELANRSDLHKPY